MLHRNAGKGNLLPNQPLELVVLTPTSISVQLLANRNLRQADVLHDGPHNGQARRFCGEGVDVIGALPNEASQAFNGIRAPNIAMHDLRKRIERQ